MFEFPLKAEPGMTNLIWEVILGSRSKGWGEWSKGETPTWRPITEDAIINNRGSHWLGPARIISQRTEAEVLPIVEEWLLGKLYLYFWTVLIWGAGRPWRISKGPEAEGEKLCYGFATSPCYISAANPIKPYKWLYAICSRYQSWTERIWHKGPKALDWMTVTL